MELIETFPMMYGIGKTGKVQQWQVSVHINDEGIALIRKDYGQVGGKIKTTDKNIYEGKNIGKANETTPVEQALSEAKSAVNKKYDKNHEYEMIDPLTYRPRKLLPQLCKGVKKGKIDFPALMGKKLNGVCCLAEKTLSNLGNMIIKTEDVCYRSMIFHSRGGKKFPGVRHLAPLLYPIMDIGDIFHGELYKHGWSLQKINSYVKKLRKDGHQMQFWVYDLALVGPTQNDRIKYLLERIPEEYLPIIRVLEHHVVNNYDEVDALHDEWVSQGFEGGVIRNMEGIYLFEYNSDDLEKAKAYQDSEFEIIGYKEGVGLEEGCIIFRCRTKSGAEFDVRPTGSREDRKWWFENGDSFIGKFMTVKYAELSDDGIPLQVVGKPETLVEAMAIRDYE